MTTNTPNPARTRAAVCPIKTAARRLVVERGGQGVTNALVRAEVQGRDTVAVGTVLAKMTRAGELVAAKVPGHLQHWFANSELAWRWEAATVPKPTRTPAPHQHLRTTGAGGASVHVPKPRSRVDQPTIVPAGLVTERTNDLTHDPRYQCAPGERPHGAGFAAAGIGRDVTTGSAWGATA